MDFTETILELNKQVAGLQVTHTKFGEGTIVQIESIENMSDAGDMAIRIHFNDGDHLLCYMACVNKQLMEDIPVLTDTINTVITPAFEQEKVEAEAAYLAEKEAEKRALEEERYNKQVERELKRLNGLSVANIANDFDDVERFYYILGWIAGHVTTIRAAMPDYAESWFTSRFGNVPHTTVDSKKRTVNGNPMQWALSMHISFKRSENTPEEIASKYSNANRTINSISFVWDLVDKYNFTFGKTQDIEAIKETIPEEYMNEFELGLNAD